MLRHTNLPPETSGSFTCLFKVISEIVYYALLTFLSNTILKERAFLLSVAGDPYLLCVRIPYERYFSKWITRIICLLT